MNKPRMKYPLAKNHQARMTSSNSGEETIRCRNGMVKYKKFHNCAMLCSYIKSIGRKKTSLNRLLKKFDKQNVFQPQEENEQA